MVKYSCKRCGKEFSQKSHYDSHNRRKTPCENNAAKIKALVDKAVEEELNNKKLIVENEEEVIINTLVEMNDKLKVISLFTGIGGMDMGFDGEVIVHKDSIINKEFIDKPHTTNDFVVLKKNKFECVFQNDILEGAKEVFGFNNDNSKYNTTSIYNLISENFVFPKADIIIGGFPCFIAGTKVLTHNGYKNIEEVVLTDTLMTHTGRFQTILNLQKKIYTGKLYYINLKYHSDTICCTQEHPFYVREKARKWNNELRNYEYEFKNPEWKKAHELDNNHYFGMKINENTIIPEFTFNKSINQHKHVIVKIKLDNPDMWFMMGYFIGDGWIEETTKADGRCMNKIRFSINTTDENIVLHRINNILKLTDKKCSSGDKCNKYGCADFVWFNIFKQFGKYAHGKLIPEWVQDAPKEYIQEFIDGYMLADGCINQKTKKYRMTTVSHNLALGVQRLFLKLGHLFGITKFISPKTIVIEGRTVNQRDTYTVGGYIKENVKKFSSFFDDGYVWYAPNKIEKEDVENEPVYNFEVENDNSYIVENIIVHNCQDFSHAGKRKGFKSNKGHDLKEKVDIEKENNRGTLYKSFVEVVKKVQPKMFVAENVYGLITMKNEPIKQIMNDFAELGYDVNYQIVYCPEFGIPQTRKRVIIMGISKKRSVDINEGWNIITKNKAECCIGKYFEHLVEPDITNDISQMVYSKAKKLKKGQGQTEINLDTFAPTMRAEHHGNIEFRRHANSKININENTMNERRLTVREAGLIQTFPPDYVFSKKKYMVAYKYIGNAVPPLLGYLIADKVNELCKRHFA